MHGAPWYFLAGNHALHLLLLTLKADDVGCLSMLTGRPSPCGAPEPYFQGMLNMPDQAFTFTISNLSNEGMINFNILHTPHRVSEVDPGPAYGINEVNELHQNQSYTIEADQRNKRKMILTGKTKAVKDLKISAEKQVPLTVKDSEATETPMGLYFYLNVVPDKACKELVDKFAEGTVWKAAPGFIRHVPGSVYPQYDYLFKILLIGDHNVGKSSLLSRFCRDEFRLETDHTIDQTFVYPSSDFFIKTIQLEDKTIKLQLWNIPRYEHLQNDAPQRIHNHALQRTYFRGCSGIIVVYDVTNAESFNNVEQWLHQIDQYAPESVNKLLVGNKCDLRHLRAVEMEKAMAFSEQHNLAFIEASALDGTGVETTFRRIATEIYDRVMREQRLYSGPPAIRLGAPQAAASLRGAALGFQGMAASLRRAMPFQERAQTSASMEAQASVVAARARRASGSMEAPASVVDAIPQLPLPEVGTRFAEQVDVGSTQAAELKHGDRVAVQSSYTGHDYAYEHCSEPTVLCMSIWEDMKFLGLTNIEEELAEEVEEWVKNEGKALIESLNAIFKADTCVVDLESEADTIVCTCGHQCLNHANVGNLRKCPMCRLPITAFVRADGIVVEYRTKQ